MGIFAEMRLIVYLIVMDNTELLVPTFGGPRNVIIDGLVMDVDHIEHQVVERNNDQERWKAYITGPVALASPP